MAATLRSPRHQTARRHARAGAAWLVAVFGLAPLAGCGSFSMPFFGSKSDNKATAACPATAVLRPLADTAVFGAGGERNPINVAYYGILSDVSATCKMTGATLHAALDIVIAAERAPAGTGDGVDLDYFVAVTGPNNAILSKNPFSVHIPIGTSAKRGGVTDHVEEAIDTGGRPLSDLNIVVGFQQNADAIGFYKNFRGR